LLILQHMLLICWSAILLLVMCIQEKVLRSLETKTNCEPELKDSKFSTKYCRYRSPYIFLCVFQVSQCIPWSNYTYTRTCNWQEILIHKTVPDKRLGCISFHWLLISLLPKGTCIRFFVLAFKWY
jgi:hypothetical protein